MLVNLGMVIMEPGVSDQLGKAFLNERQVERWKVATTRLFVEGEIRRDGWRFFSFSFTVSSG